MGLIEILSLISIFQWLIILFCLLPLVYMNLEFFFRKEKKKFEGKMHNIPRPLHTLSSMYFAANSCKLNKQACILPWIKSSIIYIVIISIMSCIIGQIIPKVNYTSLGEFVNNQPYLSLIIIVVIIEVLLVLYLISESNLKEKVYFGLYLLTLRLTLIIILNMILNDSTGEIILSMSIFDMFSKLGVIDNISVQFKGFTNIFQGFSRISKFIKALGTLVN